MGKILLCAGVFFAGLLLFGAAREAWRLGEERKWATVAGVIDKAKHFEADGSTWIDLKYDYEVDGRSYSDSSTVDTDQTLRIPAAYQEGSEVVVHYDANQPDRSYVQFAGYESPIGLAIFGGVVLLICSPFAAYYGLQIYADLMLRRARHHMREGLKALQEGQDEIDAMRARGEEIAPETLEREKEIVSQAKEAYEMLREMERERASNSKKPSP